MTKKLQFVWPKDGPKGRSGHRGFFGRANNILTGKGPDIFLQRKGSSTPIAPDYWGNWDSYHDRGYHYQEQAGPWATRGIQRYDPYSRTYEDWTIPHDWDGVAGEQGIYPRFTESEGRKIVQRLKKGRPVDLSKMGSDWHADGPRRFRQEHNEFWQNAHRIGENHRQGLFPYDLPNPFFQMTQRWNDEVGDWIQNEDMDQVWNFRRTFPW